MACQYCAESATMPSRPPMTEKTLLFAWQLLDAHGGAGRRSIRLGSGEPLLEMSLLHKIVEHVESSDEPRPTLHITTNGILASKEVIDWLVETGWNVKISLDGPKAIHDRWRVTPDGEGTYDRVAEAATDLADRLPANRYSVNAVLSRGTDPQEAFDKIAALGVRRIELVPVASDDPSVLPNDQDLARYEQFVMAYARRYLESDNWEIIPVLAQFKRYVYRLMGYNLWRAGCGAGRNFVGIGPDGAIYPCFRFIGVDSYKIGQLPDGVDQQASLTFQRGAGRAYDRRRTCSTCWAAPICGGPCFACAEMFGPGEGEPIPFHCSYELADASAAVWLVGQLRRNDPDRLLAFLPDAIMRELL